MQPKQSKRLRKINAICPPLDTPRPLSFRTTARRFVVFQSYKFCTFVPIQFFALAMPLYVSTYTTVSPPYEYFMEGIYPLQMPDYSQNFNRYSYCLNNPLKYTDTSGEIFWLAAKAYLLFTDVEYNIQKAISPVAIHIDLDFGSHGNGIGMDVSVGIPQTFPINYRYDIGASYYFNRVGGYGSGRQVRNGAEWGVGIGPFQIQYGRMRYRDWNDEGLQADQIAHTVQIGTPLINASYSNDTKESFPWADYVPLIPKLREGNIKRLGGRDRYRTASGRLPFGLFEAGFFLHTGEGRGFITTDGISHMTGGSIGDSRRSNGILYFGFVGLNIGWDSEGIRQTLQNDFAHDFLNGGKNGSSYPWVLILKRSPRLVFQFGGF